MMRVDTAVKRSCIIVLFSVNSSHDKTESLSADSYDVKVPAVVWNVETWSKCVGNSTRHLSLRDVIYLNRHYLSWYRIWHRTTFCVIMLLNAISLLLTCEMTSLLVAACTRCYRKVNHLMFDNNFGKCGPILPNSFTRWKNFENRSAICQSYYQTSSSLLFWDTMC